MAKSAIRVVLPTGTYAFLGLVNRIVKKHNEAGGESPLLVLNTICWETMGEKRRQCFETQQRAEALRREVEQLTAEKNNLQKELLGAVRAARDVLLGIYAQNPKVLGEWGFEVNHSPSKASKKAAAAKAKAKEET